MCCYEGIVFFFMFVVYDGYVGVTEFFCYSLENVNIKGYVGNEG